MSSSYIKIFYILLFGGKRWKVCIPLLKVNELPSRKAWHSMNWNREKGPQNLHWLSRCSLGHCLSFPVQIKGQTGLGCPLHGETLTTGPSLHARLVCLKPASGGKSLLKQGGRVGLLPLCVGPTGCLSLHSRLVWRQEAMIILGSSFGPSVPDLS